MPRDRNRLRSLNTVHAAVCSWKASSFEKEDTTTMCLWLCRAIRKVLLFLCCFPWPSSLCGLIGNHSPCLLERCRWIGTYLMRAPRHILQRVQISPNGFPARSEIRGRCSWHDRRCKDDENFQCTPNASMLLFCLQEPTGCQPSAACATQSHV
jgi:hypothetical protein